MKKLHGLATRKNRHPLLKRWMQMRQRCENKNDRSYHNYGARGIKVCERWQSFKNFVDDVFPSFVPGLTLDRINNDGNYEPSNCRWASCKQQSQNSRHLRLLEFHGIIQSQRDWAECMGIREQTLCNRLAGGWSLERALLTQPKSGGHY